jgi:hypothetical protein
MSQAAKGGTAAVPLMPSIHVMHGGEAGITAPVKAG